MSHDQILRIERSGYNSELVHLAVSHDSPQEVLQNDPFGVGTSVHVLDFNRSMALLLGVFSKSATVNRPSEATTDQFLQEVTFNTVGIASR